MNDAEVDSYRTSSTESTTNESQPEQTKIVQTAENYALDNNEANGPS